MTRFFLIRHGETDWNVTGRWQGHTDIPLNKIGLMQAQRLAARLRSEGQQFDAIYSSDLQRAWTTALAVGEVTGVVPQAVLALREINLGTWSGKTRPEIAAYDAETLARVDAGEDVPRGGAERLADLYERVSAALEQLAELHPQATLAVVTHGGTIRAALTHALRQNSDTIWHHEHIGNTSITVVRRTIDRWEIERINDMDHLEGSPQAPDLMSVTQDDVQQA